MNSGKQCSALLFTCQVNTTSELCLVLPLKFLFLEKDLDMVRTSNILAIAEGKQTSREGHVPKYTSVLMRLLVLAGQDGRELLGYSHRSGVQITWGGALNLDV